MKLAYALKIIINTIYGLTFMRNGKSRFRDPRNIDNIVAKRGALFMCQLRHEVEDLGYKPIHIKTDSIKIPDPDETVINYIIQRGKDYGYTFEVEEEFDRICLVNKAVYVGKLTNGEWTATGEEFQHPYIFKTLFSKENVEYKDLCEIRQVQNPAEMYLDFNESNPEEHNYHFIGKVGSFVPVKEGCGGGILVRKTEDKESSVNGTKGYRWKESYVVKDMEEIDHGYYNLLAKKAKEHISEFCDYDLFVSDETFISNNVVYSTNKLNDDIPFDV